MRFDNLSNFDLGPTSNPDAIGPSPLTFPERNIDIGGPVYGEYLEHGGLRDPLPLPSVMPSPMPISPIMPGPIMGIDNFQSGMQQAMGPRDFGSTYTPFPTRTDLGPGYGPYDCAGYGPFYR